MDLEYHERGNMIERSTGFSCPTLPEIQAFKERFAKAKAAHEVLIGGTRDDIAEMLECFLKGKYYVLPCSRVDHSRIDELSKSVEEARKMKAGNKIIFRWANRREE